jgi:uncharacterized protein DUF4236
MGFRFYRRLRILPGLRLNVGKTGVSASIGGRGAWATFRRGHRVRTTVGLPGSGLSYTEGGQSAPTQPERVIQAGRKPGLGWLWIVLAAICAIVGWKWFQK